MKKIVKAAMAMALSVILLASAFPAAVFADVTVGDTNYLTTKWNSELFQGTITETEEDGAAVTTYVPQWQYSWFSPTIRIYNDIKGMLGDKSEINIVIAFEVKGVFTDPASEFKTHLVVRAANPKTNDIGFADTADNWDGSGSSWTDLYSAKDKGGIVFGISGNNNLASIDPSEVTMNGSSWTEYRSEPIRITADEMDDTLFGDWIFCFDSIEYNANLTGVQFRNTAIYLVEDMGPREYKEAMSRDQVTVNGVDKALFGGNAEVTDIAENLYDLKGETIRFWGWYGNNKALDKFGLKLDGGDMKYYDRYSDPGIYEHLKNNVFHETDIYCDRYEVTTEITEGEHTAEIYAIVEGEGVLLWTVNYKCLPDEDIPPVVDPEDGIYDFNHPNSTQIGMSLDTIFWNGEKVGNREKAESYASEDGTLDGTALGGTSIGYHGWVCFSQEVKQFGYMINGKLVFDPDFTVENELGLVDTIRGWGDDWANGYPQRYTITIPLDGADGEYVVCGVVELADGKIVKMNDNIYHDRETTFTIRFAAQAPTEDQPQTGDNVLAAFAVVAVLAMSAAVVFARKKTY